MEDALTDTPPPSRFFQTDLNSFIPRSSSLPSPFLLLPNRTQISPSLLIVSISSPSLYLFHRLSSKTLIGTLVLPEIPFSGNSIEPSLTNKSCNIYALDDADPPSILLVSFQCSVPPERSHAVAKLLVGGEGEQISPKRVLILDSVQSRNFRGKLSVDDAFVFKLESKESRLHGSMLKDLDYFPSGSVIDGLAAALLARSQVCKIGGTLCVSWPESGRSAVSLLKSLMLKLTDDESLLLSKGVVELFKRIGDCDGDDDGDDTIRGFESELYT